jgi:murein DD-endopeptidase MepM/ murein hydrolase activator NlpD
MPDAEEGGKISNRDFSTGRQSESGMSSIKMIDQEQRDTNLETQEAVADLEDSIEVSHNRWFDLWQRINRAGLGNFIFRLGTTALLFATVLVVAWGMRAFFRNARALEFPGQAVKAAELPTATPTELPALLPPVEIALENRAGLMRLANLHTDVPSRPRTEVITYTVQTGDTLFGIAEQFGLKPETLLWGNQFVLGDNPHSLRPDQVLNILPVNGTYHRWSEGDGLNGVAKFFGVTPEDIINFPGNHLDAETIGDLTRPNIKAGTWLMIPGGKRSFVSWSLPPGGIPRENPSVARGFGTGVCGSQVDGSIGTGLFVWPANSHAVTGFDWSPDSNHSGIDISGSLNNPVYAADNGVVVYSGWNDWGYGNVVVINHGNGWQTLYAHLNVIGVNCGDSVFQGGQIGAIGSTGNSTGPHLHFEMMYNGVKVNPHDYLP